MVIDHCLILAAGFGTRMGTIGQKLPKVLWPVFERPLLELQVAYARSLGAKNIFINLHYLGKEIEDACRGKSAFEGVTFLWEKPEILDIGGAIHNLAAQSSVAYKGKLLVLNADQFFYVPSADLARHLDKVSGCSTAIFTYWVNSSLGYNAIKVDANRRMKEIVPNKDLAPNARVETYTGISFVDLASLKPYPGVSNFWDSVAIYKKQDVATLLLEDTDYWDFGTLKRYWETSFRILDTYRDNSNHPFLRFLVAERALKTWKIGLQSASYHSKTPRVINLAPDLLTEKLGPSIILKASKLNPAGEGRVYWGDVSEEVK